MLFRETNKLYQALIKELITLIKTEVEAITIEILNKEITDLKCNSQQVIKILALFLIDSLELGNLILLMKCRRKRKKRC